MWRAVCNRPFPRFLLKTSRLFKNLRLHRPITKHIETWYPNIMESKSGLWHCIVTELTTNSSCMPNSFLCVPFVGPDTCFISLPYLDDFLNRKHTNITLGIKLIKSWLSYNFICLFVFWFCKQNSPPTRYLRVPNIYIKELCKKKASEDMHKITVIAIGPQLH